MRALQDDRDIAVARRPWIAEELPAFVLKELRQMITQPIEGLAQGLPPALMPSWFPPRLAATITAPALDAMGAAPRGVFNDFDHLVRRETFKILAVVSELDQVLAGHRRQRIRQGHFTKAVMMPIRLTISGHMHQLGMVASVMEPPQQSLD